MKNPFIAVSLLALMSAISIVSSYADNENVEDAIKSRPDLSTFYQALINTGVNHELRPDMSYSVFAPTNQALARISQEQYPCFYRAACREEVAMIVRNHIIPGKVYIDDAAKQKGGLYSIGGRFVTIGEPFRNDYAVAGNNVLYMAWYGSGILYKIDGVIANPLELAMLEYPAEYAGLSEHVITQTTQKTIPDPACGPGGCPDAVTQTITVTRTVVEPSVLTAPMLAPANR